MQRKRIKKTNEEEPMKEVEIIGGGPIGNYLAHALAKDFDVSVYEEDKNIGKPVQCTGILTKEIRKIIPIKKEFVVNKAKYVKIYSPNDKYVMIETDEYIINRAVFDRYIADKAIKNGAEINLKTRLVGKEKNNLVFNYDGSKRKVDIKNKIIIGADGPTSITAKLFGMDQNKEFYISSQIIGKGNFNAEGYDVYLGSVAKGFFAWVVPESNNIARIGLACRLGKCSPNKLLERFIKRIKERYGKITIKEKGGGLIPIFNPRKKNEFFGNSYGVFLAGDAGGYVKATTGGGIVPGLKAVDSLSDYIKRINSIKTTDNYKTREYRLYKKRTSAINKELKKHLMIRKFLNRFNDDDYNNLIYYIKNKKIINLINKMNKESTRDSINNKIIINGIKAVIKEPRLLFFAKKLVS